MKVKSQVSRERNFVEVKLKEVIARLILAPHA